MASKTPGSSTVRKTLLDFDIDPKAKKELDQLIRQLNKLEKASQEASKQLNQNLSAIKNSPRGREALSQNLKNEVNTQRKIVEQNNRTAQNIIDQISKSVGQGLSPKQRDQLTRGLSSAMGEITGRFTKSVKKQAEEQARGLKDFYEREFRKSPTVSGRQRIQPARVERMSEGQLRSGLEVNAVRQRGAKAALNYAINTGDKRLERSAARALQGLEQGTQAATKQLNNLKTASAEAAREQKKQAKIAEQQAKRAAGPSPEQQRINRRLEQIRQTRTNNQLDGGAHLFRNQGMLLRNYAVMGAGVGAVGTSATFSVELDRQFKQLQSIVNLTNDEMEELSKNLIDVSEKTKFTATEVADAAITLGQAGLGQKDIQNAIEGVTLFATAVGSDLKSAVDLATSTLGVFNKDSSQMVNIVDKMTTAVNNSKLNLDKLALGLQYSGNLAAQSNVTFEETVSALGAMANSGIRAGSTLGTGLRQIIIALQKPSEAFVETIHNLGLSMSDLDINTHGLIPVMETLAQRGFTVRDAMETMQVRAASAYGAFANNIGVARDLSDQMLIGGAAARANETQMEALSNQLDRLGSISKSIIYESLDPLFDTVAKLTEKTADFLSVVRDLGPALSAIAVPLSVLGSVLAARSVLKLGAGLLGTKSLLGGIGGPGKLGVASRVASRFGAGGVAKYAMRAIPGVGLATLAGTAGIYGYNMLDSSARANDRVDLTQGALNRSEANTKSYEDQLKRVGGEIDNLILKQYELTKNDALMREIRRLNDEFRQQGLYIDSSVQSYDQLIAKMKEFEGETSNAVRYLQDENRNNYTEASAAKIDELFAGGFFEGEGEKVARAGFGALGSRLYAPGVNVNPQSGIEEKVLTKALPNLTTDLQKLNESIKGILPGTEGSYGRATDARAQAQALQSQLYGVLNQSPQELDALMSSFGLEGDSREDMENFIEDFANAIRARTFTLLTVEKEQLKYKNLDSGKLEEEKALDELIQGYRRGLLDSVAETQETMGEVKSKNKSLETRNYLDTFYEIEDLASARIDEIFADEKRVLEELKTKGYSEADARLLLQEQGYFQAQGDARNRIQRSLQSAAQDAQPDADKYFPAKISQVEKELGQVMNDLRNVTEQEKSDALLERAKALIEERESLNAQFDNFASTLKGESLPVIRAREDEAIRNTRIGQQEAETVQARTLNRRDLTNALNIRDDIPLMEFRELNDDDELTRLLSDFAGEQRTQITNLLEEQRQEADQLRRQAEDKAREAQEYVAIAQDDGFTDERRRQAAAIANGLLTDSVGLRKDADSLEQDGIRQAKDSLAELAVYIREQIIDNDELSDGRAKNKAGKINEDLAKQGLDFDSEIASLGRSSKEASQELTDFRKEMSQLSDSIHISQYETDAFNRVRAQIYGESYLPIGGKARDKTFEGKGGQTFSSRAANAGTYLVDEVGKGYEGFNMLTQFTLEATAAAKGMGDAFGSALTDIVTGVSDAGDAFKAFFRDLATQVADMATRALANQLMSSIFGSFAGGMYTGGPVIAGNYATGGLITSGMASRDSTYAHVSRGEFILRKRAVDALGLETVRALNAADPSSVSQREDMTSQAATASMKAQSSERGVANFYAVLPDEVPESMGPNDVVMHVAENYRNGGVLKKLIASKEL